MSQSGAGAGKVRIHRERWDGPGAPVVLSHGLGDEMSTWGELVPLVAPIHTVVAWDLRGHGKSDAPHVPEDYSAELAIEDLLGVIDEIGEPVHLVGHSLGGYLSLTLALRRPELVRSLTMIASGPGYRDDAARDEWNRYVERAVLNMPIPAEAAGLGIQEDSFVIDHTPELAVPMLVLIGERDKRFQAGASFLARAAPGSTLIQIANAGHHPQRRHAEEVSTALLAHLDGRP